MLCSGSDGKNEDVDTPTTTSGRGPTSDTNTSASSLVHAGCSENSAGEASNLSRKGRMSGVTC